MVDLGTFALTQSGGLNPDSRWRLVRLGVRIVRYLCDQSREKLQFSFLETYFLFLSFLSKPSGVTEP